jgi:peroxiredoxin
MNIHRRFLILSITFLSLRAGAQVAQGHSAPDIALPDVNGDTLHLNSFKGKVVLLDFWASWCRPCRAANKDLVKVYARYHQKGFEIYSVSIDEESHQWKDAIKKDKITWKQVIDPKGWYAHTAVSWNIDAIPTTFLINKKGVLVAMDMEGRDLEKAIDDLLAQN